MPFGNATEFELYWVKSAKLTTLQAAMPALLKRTRLLEEVAVHYVQQKRARTMHMVSQLLDDFPSSDTQPSSPISFASSSSSSSISTVSSPSSYESDCSSSPLLDTHSEGSSTCSEGDFDGLED
jgi:hypothetical protein